MGNSRPRILGHEYTNGPDIRVFAFHSFFDGYPLAAGIRRWHLSKEHFS